MAKVMISWWNKDRWRIFFAILLSFVVVVVEACKSVDTDDVTISETGEFVREGSVFTKISFNNMEIIDLPDGRYRAFFHDGPSAIQSAISEDGRHFQIEEGDRLFGSMPATVLLEEGQWRMYFARGGEILSALSDDGFSFNEEPGVRLQPGGTDSPDEHGITHLNILKLPDGTFRLYYDGQFRPDPGPWWHIMSANSEDGLTWVKDEGVRIPVEGTTIGDFKFNHVFSPHVKYRQGTYELYFTSEGSPLHGSGIWRATSSDGLNFSIQAQPVLARDPEFGDSDGSSTVGGPPGVPQDPFLIKVPEGDRLFYWTSDKGYQSALRVQE